LSGNWLISAIQDTTPLAVSNVVYNKDNAALMQSSPVLEYIVQIFGFASILANTPTSKHRSE